jgi:RND family efflux transporter MFP subunit
MNARPLFVWLSLPLLTLLPGAAPPPIPRPPEVEVVQPVNRQVSDYEDFTGRTDASATVHIKARVSGYLTRVLFKDGAEVKQGDLLFEIDPRPYKAQLEKAEAAVTLAQAGLTRAEADYKRARALFDRKALGKEELDRTVAARDEAQARLKAGKAARKMHELNLNFTRVAAPISGRIGRRLLDVGNLAREDETELATLVSLKPLYVYFDMDERTFLRLRRERAKGLAVAMGLASDRGFPHRAKVDYLANRVDPKTGTLRLRATLPNPKAQLVPGLFARVRLTTSKPYQALLVPHQATGRKKEQSYVLVVNEKNRVEVREVRLGQQHGDLVVVKEGLRAGDQVVLKWPAGLKEGMIVKPKRAP